MILLTWMWLRVFDELNDWKAEEWFVIENYFIFLRSFFAIHRDAYNQVKEKVMRIGKTDAGRMIRNEPTTHCPWHSRGKKVVLTSS